jgi:pimeloyl-ACP methyl ester carboxylesterase
MKRLFLLMTALLFAASVAAEEPMVLRAEKCDLYGTLAVPESGSRTVALIIAGSGATDRDGNNRAAGLITDCYKQLSDSLVANGYAALRYDKRAIAASASPEITEAELSFDDYINDAVAWADLLAAGERFDRVVLIGHSEGSLIALAAAKRTDKVAAVISLAGPGEPIDQTLRRQLATQPEPYKTECYRIIDELKAGRMVEDAPAELAALFRKSVQPFLISEMRYNPADEARMLRVPLLIVQGTTDIQVETTDAARLFMAQRMARMVMIDDMNHVLKICPTTNPQQQMATYMNPSLPIAAKLVRAVVDFMGNL